MDEILLRRIVGLLTLVTIAFLLSWLLPRPGLESLESDGQKLVSIDLASNEIVQDTPSVLNRADADDLSSFEQAPDDLRGDEGNPSFAGQTEAKAGEQTQSTSQPTPRPKPEPKSAPPVAAKPEPRPQPKPQPKPEPTPKPEPKPAPEPAPSPEPAPKPKPKPPEPPATPKPAASSGGRFLVQAGAFSQISSARAMLARASLQSVDCVISPADTAKGTIYRVRCGPYDGRAKADEAVRMLARDKISAQVMSGGN